MYLTLLGTGCPSVDFKRFGPSNLISTNKTKILVDCGSGVTQRLNQISLSGSDIDVLLLTHLHSDHVIDFAVNFVRSTRLDEHTDESIKKWLNWGAGPRASSILILAGKAHALMNNRTTPEIEDIKHVVKLVLRHRIIPNFNAEADGMSCDNILDYLLNKAE